MTMEQFYNEMKNMEFQQFKRLDRDQKEFWKQLYNSLKYDFDTTKNTEESC